VARSASSWGVHIGVEGKVVWFEPRPDLREDGGAEATLTRASDLAERREVMGGAFRVRLLSVPVPAYVELDRHLPELRREIRLLALAHESAYPAARELGDLLREGQRHLREAIGTEEIGRAVSEGRSHVDLEATMARRCIDTLSRLVGLIDLSDVVCREARLVSLTGPPEQRRFLRWLLEEFIRQGGGGRPLAWTDVDTDPRHHVS